MSPKGEAGRGRERLSEEAIVTAALQLIDRDGLQALSMRKLADRLDVQPMAFYHHFPNKDALLDRVADAVIGSIEVPASDLDWAEWTRRFLHNMKDALVRHPRRVELILARPGTGADYANMFGGFVGVMAKAEVDGAAIHTAWHLVTSYLLGYFQQFHAAVRTIPRLRPLGGPAENLLLIADQIASCDDDHEFSVGLDLIIEAIQSRIDGVPVARAYRPS